MKPKKKTLWLWMTSGKAGDYRGPDGFYDPQLCLYWYAKSLKEEYSSLEEGEIFEVRKWSGRYVSYMKLTCSPYDFAAMEKEFYQKGRELKGESFVHIGKKKGW